MKKLTIYVLLLTALVSCGKSKDAIFDKCLNQANDTYGENLELKGVFVSACMIEHNYAWEDCDRRSENALLPICYELRKNK